MQCSWSDLVLLMQADLLLQLLKIAENTRTPAIRLKMVHRPRLQEQGQQTASRLLQQQQQQQAHQRQQQHH